MAVGVRFEDIRRPQGVDAVDHHTAAFAIEHTERQVVFEVFPWDNLIDRVLGEIVRP